MPAIDFTVDFSETQQIYVILGIDANAHDQVLAVCRTYDDAKQYCIDYLMETEFYDLWIEKHHIL